MPVPEDDWTMIPPHPEENSSQPGAVPAQDEGGVVRRELNLLILGKTGVGKSSWINSFINFLRHDSLQDAELGELFTLIHTKFMMYDVETFEEIQVVTGSDQNEEMATGQSATQEARVYTFQVGNVTIRLIDTPGIGDTKGLEQDKKNFQNVLGTLSHLKEIHGVLILLKPNDARLDVMFRFCVKELLTYLHKDASKNIVFCFTNSRATNWRGGDTVPALKKLLSENGNVEIGVNAKTTYFFDSEPYRYLAAIKNNPPVKFSAEEVDNYGKSWERSITSTKKMLEYILSLQPHPVQSTLNLNHARQLVLKMVRPLAEISRNIQTNRAIVEDEKKDIEKTNETIEDLKMKQWTKRTVIEVKRLDGPKTVCSNTQCVKIWEVDGVTINEYVTICHENCGLPGVQEDSIGAPELKDCIRMTNGICDNCGHYYQEHLHHYYDSVQVVKQVENQAVKESLQQNLSAADMKQKMLDEKNEMIQEYEFELKEIEKASVTFAYFLRVNAITPYNDGMEMFLNQLIKQEKDKVESGGDRKTLDYLITSKDSYLFEKSILEQQMKMGEGSPPTPGEIELLIKKLKGLKLSGKELKDALDCVKYTEGRVFIEGTVKAPLKGNKQWNTVPNKDGEKSKFFNWF